MLSCPDVFQFSIFLNVALSESRCMSASGPSSSPCNSFPSYLFIWLFCYVLFVPIFYPKIVFFLFFIRLLICYCTIASNLAKFSFAILECPVWFVLFNPISAYFESLFFRQYHLLYSFWFTRLVSVLFLFSFCLSNVLLCVFLSLIFSLLVALSLFLLLAKFFNQVLYFCLESWGGGYPNFITD